MPSPRRNRIVVSICGDGISLNPLQSVELPRNIQPGHHVLVAGEIKALVCHENTTTQPRKSGQKLLRQNVEVRLKATFLRLGRSLPEFHTDSALIRQICIRYPLELEPPRYLDSVIKGDKFMVRWRVRVVLFYEIFLIL